MAMSPCAAAAEVSARLREELRAAREEVARVSALRDKERAEAADATTRAEEMHKASLSRAESEMAAKASQAALELEHAKKELLHERAITQEIVTEAKQEAATAHAHALEAREDALRWQRAMNPSTSTAYGAVSSRAARGH